MSNLNLTPEDEVRYIEFKQYIYDNYKDNFSNGDFTIFGQLIAKDPDQCKYVHLLNDEFGLELFEDDFFNDSMEGKKYTDGVKAWLLYRRPDNINIKLRPNGAIIIPLELNSNPLPQLNIIADVTNCAEGTYVYPDDGPRYVNNLSIRYTGNNSNMINYRCERTRTSPKQNVIFDCSKVTLRQIQDIVHINELTITENVKEFFIYPDDCPLKDIISPKLTFKKHELTTNQYTINMLKQLFGEDAI